MRYNFCMNSEERFLSRLGSGANISQDDYNQMAEFIAPEALARALVRRFECNEDIRALQEAARLFLLADLPYQALEVCSRYPKIYALQKLTQEILPHLRQAYQEEYPSTHMVGRLLEEAFLVVDLSTGQVTRYPPIMPSI